MVEPPEPIRWPSVEQDVAPLQAESMEKRERLRVWESLVKEPLFPSLELAWAEN
jgi:hypothetical protein